MSILQALYKMKTFVFVFLFLAKVETGVLENIPPKNCISRRCNCSLTEEKITAVCVANKLELLPQIFTNPEEVATLDLSNNNIRNITENAFVNFSGLVTLSMTHNLLIEIPSLSFQGLENLIELSIAQNYITHIHRDAFYGLRRLRTLNLTGNKIKVWNTFGCSGYLQSLRNIDVKGNVGWTPEKSLLQLRKLEKVNHVTWSSECKDCLFSKVYGETNIDEGSKFIRNITKPGSCVKYHFRGSDFLMLLARNKFVVNNCWDLKKCFDSEIINYTISHSCWLTTQRVFTVHLLVNVAGGIFNFIVFANILSTKSLRKNVSLSLISNLALGDTMSSIYSVTISSIIMHYKYEEWHFLAPTVCPMVGFFWVLGQCTSSITSLLLTIERHLCITFSMNPDVRMTPRIAFFAVTFNWFFAVCMVAYAAYADIFKYNFLCLPISFIYPSAFHYIFGLGMTGIILYVATIPLYIHIYIVVKRSSQQMGVQRESTLAKRIALLVITNLVFFFVPIFALGTWVLFKDSQKTANMSIYLRHVLEEWIPLYCLSINSCLNPVVHAFRNDKFKQVLKRRFQTTSAKVSSLTSFRSRSTNKSVRVAPATIASSSRERQTYTTSIA